MASALKQIVVVLGAGPGVGFSVAQKFAAQGHPVALLSRSLPTLESLASQITQSGGSAKAYSVDATNEPALRSTIKQVANDFPGAHIHTGVFSANGGFSMKPFLETTSADLDAAYKVQVHGGFVFAQSIVEAISKGPEAEGNVFLTGATASLKGGANFSAFAASKFALRALSQSLAREWGPKGVHVAHFIIDGLVVTERTDKMLGTNYEKDTRMDPDAIAQVFLDTARQPKSAWSHEIDLRPFTEKW